MKRRELLKSAVIGIAAATMLPGSLFGKTSSVSKYTQKVKRGEHYGQATSSGYTPDQLEFIKRISNNFVTVSIQSEEYEYETINGKDRMNGGYNLIRTTSMAYSKEPITNIWKDFYFESFDKLTEFLNSISPVDGSAGRILIASKYYVNNIHLPEKSHSGMVTKRIDEDLVRLHVSTLDENRMVKSDQRSYY